MQDHLYHDKKCNPGQALSPRILSLAALAEGASVHILQECLCQGHAAGRSVVDSRNQYGDESRSGENGIPRL